MKLFIAFLLAAMLTAACSSGGDTEGSASGASGTGGGSGAVTVDDFSFTPESTEVAAGDEVEWVVAEGSSAHTVKFEDEESDELAAGQSYSRTFDEAGEYTYICGIHPQMTGAVSVK